MKNYCYSDIDNETFSNANQHGYSNTDNEKRKMLSIETNRRRRDMAIRVKRQIEKEEERRKEVLRERREYHESLTNKMRKTRHSKTSSLRNTHQTNQWGLDQTLSMIRQNSSNSSINYKNDLESHNANYKPVLENVWSDNREGYLSPMAKYSGTYSGVKSRTNDFYLKTFETKLMAQEQSFKEKQNQEMLEFSRILDETVDRVDRSNYNNTYNHHLEHNVTIPSNSRQSITKESEKSVIISNLDIEDILDDSLNDSSDEIVDRRQEWKKEIVIETKANDAPTIVHTPTNNKVNNIKSGPIKSILKKDLHSKFISNPDLSGIAVKDSVEVTRIKSARMRRSNSFSQGINHVTNRLGDDDKSGIDDENGRKIVRFADDHYLNKHENNDVIVTNGLDHKLSSEKVLENPKSPTNFKVQKPPTVPNSTPLKPPLHPRSIQEGSYLQNSSKKVPVFHPPPKPRKISAEVLDNEIGAIISQRKPLRSPNNVTIPLDMGQQRESSIPLDKTPTEREIDQLWAEVRECLSKKQHPSKTGSAGTPAAISVRTIDSGSESSVRSAPAWQRNVKKPTPPFQVRHHAPITLKQNIYQGQEPPLKDLIIVHTPHEHHIHSGVTQQELSVLSKQDQGFQQVSESLEEFLATENACHLSQTPRNVFQPHPPLLSRPQIRPPIKSRLFIPPVSPSIPSSYNSSNIHKTQLSLDEENIKMSLDKLNERLKNVTNIL